MKKAQVAIWVMIAVMIAAAIVFVVVISNSKGGEIIFYKQCETDSDCVPAECCHATECAVNADAPQCSEVFCTAECAAGTLDCGQGECKCVNGKCAAVFK